MLNNKIYDTNRLPLGLVGFSNIRKSNMIYVDKTELIAEIANQRTPIFFSRPRRFGKSLLINTLKCLFSKGLSDFKGLAIENQWNDTIYKVVHIDFSNMANSNTQDFKRDLGEIIIQEFKANTVQKYDELGIRNPNIILREIVQDLEDNSIVLLIDEYDAPLTHHINDSQELKNIMSILNNFYATVKQYTDKFRLVFITGVTRASHVSIFSAFNNLLDLSLEEEFNHLLGFTQDDLEKYFDRYIENATSILEMNKNTIYKRLEQYYNGFQFSIDAKETVYNPWSVLTFFKLPKNGFQDYWFESGGNSTLLFNYLKITNKFDILDYKKREIYRTKKELSCKYEITNIPIDILLFQAGYFTLRRKTSDVARFIFPNTEVEDSMLTLYLTANNIKLNINNSTEIEKLSENIDNKNLKNIVKIFNSILNDCVSILSHIFNDERSVRDIIYAALPQNITCQKIKERETAFGFSDLELITKKTHMVIEFKRTLQKRDAKTSLQEAIEQLKSKNYGIGAYQDHILYRVAMVISTEKKSILQDYCKEVL